MLAGGWAPFGAGIRSRKYPTSTTDEPLSLQRRPAAPHLAPLRPARPRGAPVRGLARPRGAGVVADAAARAARPPRLAVQVRLGVRGVAGAAGEPARCRVEGGRAGLPRAQRVLDRRLDQA